MEDIKQFEPLWGEWRSVELLGEGSYGRVYKMVKVDLDREYFSAVKHLSLPKDSSEEKNLFSEGMVTDHDTLKKYYDDVLENLRSEIDFSYKLKGHTNIVSYEDHFICPKSSGVGYDIFIKMELLTSLEDLIRQGGLNVWDAVKLGEDICRALTVVRREKIIHRDIKPGNIFINNNGDYKLGDFGVSRLMNRKMGSMTRVGTPTFMAPEVANEGHGDYRVDICSLGLVLYRLLNKNRAPFLPLPPEGVGYNANMLANKRRLQGEPLPPPADADEALSAIILKSCAYRPEDRWNSAEEMGKALAQYRSQHQVPEPEEPPDTLDETLYLKPLLREPSHSRESSQPHPSAPVKAPPSVPPEPEADPLEPDREVPEVPPDRIRSGTQPGDETMPLRRDDVLRWKNRDEPRRETPSENLKTEQKPARPEQAKSQAKAEPGKKNKPEPKAGNAGNTYLLGRPNRASGKKLAAVIGGAVLVGAVCIFALTGRSSEPEPQTNVPPAPKPMFNVSIPLELDEPERILWHDPVIRDGVLERLGVTEAELTREELAGLEELSIPLPERASEAEIEAPALISSLADLEMLPGLKSLDLSGHPVEAFDLPEEMPSLETLKLARCGCKDLKFFNHTALENLRVLDLSGNEFTDLSALSGLTGLHELDITGTQAGSLEPLRGLADLAVLSATGIPAEDWSPVEGVAQVEGRPETAEEPEPSEPPETPETVQKTSTGGSKTPRSSSKSKTSGVTSVSVSPSNAMLEVGGSVRLSANVSPSGTAKVSWSSSNPSVAVVDGGGHVSAVGRGTTRITASCGDKSASCTVTVD